MEQQAHEHGAADQPFEEGTPPGLDLADVERRSEMATYLGKEVWPAERDALVAHAEESGATDRVLAELRRLPAGQTFTNLADAWSTLGHSVEQHRT